MLLLKLSVSVEFKEFTPLAGSWPLLESELKHWGCLEEGLECSCMFLRLNKQWLKEELFRVTFL